MTIVFERKKKKKKDFGSIKLVRIFWFLFIIMKYKFVIFVGLHLLVEQ